MALERMKMRMQQQLHQEQRLTPQLLQSMEILQMNSQELLEHLNRAELGIPPASGQRKRAQKKTCFLPETGLFVGNVTG